MNSEDIALLKQYRIQCLNDKIKRYSGLLVAAGGIAAIVLFDLPTISWVAVSFTSIILALFIFWRLQ